MKKVIIIIITLLPYMLISQENTHQLNWSSNFLLETNNLSKEVLNSILYGNYISEDMKSRWILSSSDNNIINSEINNKLSYFYNYKNSSIGFSIADVNVLNARFTDDLLRLGLEGNFSYQDETLDFSGINFRADRFQQYKILFSKKIKNLNFNSGISYLVGNHHLSYIMDKGSLYTAPFGTYLNLEYDINAYSTDTSNLSLLNNNGNGVALDLGTNFSIQKFDIEISIKNLGFIIWDPSSIRLATDTIFNFQGVEVEDIFNFNDSVLDANNPINNIIKTDNITFKSYIPATISISIFGKTKYKYLKTYNIGIIRKWQPYRDNKKLSISKIKQGFTESNFSPFYYIKSIINTKHYDIIPTLSYGGYSHDSNIGLELSKGKRNKLIIGTHHLEDIFDGNNAKSFSLYVNLQLKF